MKQIFTRTRKGRYARLAVVLTVLVVAVTILANAVFFTLANRYGWYTPMEKWGDYRISKNCFTVLDTAMRAHNSAPIELIFCNTEKNILADSMVAYIYSTAKELQARYSDRISIQCYDVILNPNTVRRFAKGTNPLTGEEMENDLAQTSVIVSCGEYYRVYSLTEFFSYKNNDLSTVWAYNGERKLVSAILHAINTDKPIVCMTDNHGEVYYDYELLQLLDDAGYVISYLDLQTDPIPEKCNLIISYNPNTDLVGDTVSSVSEAARLNEFLAQDGNGFLLFLESGTPDLPNYEAFMAEWGVSCKYYHDAEANKDYRYSVQDAANSLTSDGCTIYAEPVQTGHSATLLKDLDPGVVFQNATALDVANGYVANGDGSYSQLSGNRTMYSLYESASGATSWANGAIRDGGGAILMSLTEQKSESGSSYVGAIASAKIATEKLLQSAVFENGDALFRLLGCMGKTDLPENLRIKPFQSMEISTVTTSEMLYWTLGLAITPAVLVTVAAVIVFIKRRRA